MKLRKTPSRKRPPLREESERTEPRPTLETRDWVAAARAMLIEDGIGLLKIDRLAKSLGVTRGGFYWRFRNHQDLLDHLLDHWIQENSAQFIAAIDGPGKPNERFRRWIQVVLDEESYSPDFDTAVRSWSRVSRKVADGVHTVDDQRIAALTRLFEDAGNAPDEAFVRARITYFHQVGYYAMGMKESRRRRKELSELYYRILTGFGA
jgi:AcrR family transcriptional regulator